MNHAFLQAIQGKNSLAVIAEVKKKSPSHGRFERYTPAQLIAAYHAGGASAISVVTEPTMFDGSLELLREVRQLTQLPILRKDFLESIGQIDESISAGADAVLLIAARLDKKELGKLVQHAQTQGLDTVVEIYDEEEMQKVAKIADEFPQMIYGINNRNLKTFATDVERAFKLSQKIDAGRIVIAESAFLSADDLEPYVKKVDAVLIGTSLLTSENPEQLLTQFVDAGHS